MALNPISYHDGLKISYTKQPVNLPSSKNNNCLENNDYLSFSNNKNEASLILILFFRKQLWLLTFKYSKKKHIDSYKKINN
jgi:hypothetical protein